MYGHKVKIVPGDPVNMKVTLRGDEVIVNEIYKMVPTPLS